MPYATTNGIRTHYQERGSGPAVVFIHGHSLDLRMWRYQTDDVAAAGLRAVSYDVRGHGRTAVPDGHVSDARSLARLSQVETDVAVGLG